MDFYYVKIAFYATLFTWFVTALGASMVFLFKKDSNKIMSLMFGFGAGVMIAASFFSLILPGIELADEMNQISYLVIGLGVLFGGLLIFLIDVFIPHMHINKETPEGISSSWSRKILLVLAITLHNIPEGLAIGAAVGTTGETANLFRVEEVRNDETVVLRLLTEDDATGEITCTTYTIVVRISCIGVVQCFDPINCDTLCSQLI